MGAQRLSASKIGSLAPGQAAGHPRGVLNACRRQRSVHTTFRVPAASHRFVLNACRRQRSVHELGIVRRDRQWLVLNACRRQRSVHAGAGQHHFVGHRSAQRLSASKIGSPRSGGAQA